MVVFRMLAIGICLFVGGCQQLESRSASLPNAVVGNEDARTSNDRRVSDTSISLSRKKSNILINNGKKHALVVGIGEYQDVPPLSNPTNDAAIVGESLSQIGFDVAMSLDQNFHDLKKTIKNYYDNTKGSYLNVIYFAGHAFQIAGENYLIPADFTIDDKQDSNLFERLISLDDLLKLVETSETGRTIIILDACRNNPYLESISETLSETTGRSVSVHPGLAEPAIVRSSTDEILFLYATAPGQLALDGKGDNSPFAEALSEWIIKPDVMLDDAIRGIRRDVAALTENRQVPFSTNNFSSRFRLNPKFQQIDSSVPPNVVALGGTGRLTLRPQISIWLDQVLEGAQSSYSANSDINQVEYVAVSLSGANGSKQRCKQKLSANCDDFDLANAAVDACEKKSAGGETCGLYAVIRNGVLSQIWQGQVVHFRGAQIPMAFDWEGLGLVAGLADYSSEGNGRMNLEIPAAGGHCTGSYEFTKPGIEGTFEAECARGLTLKADIVRSKASLDVYQFFGSDSLGRKFEGVFNDDG
ncbi:MAG: caspase family protein [Geminicoccales bacterium]